MKHTTEEVRRAVRDRYARVAEAPTGGDAAIDGPTPLAGEGQEATGGACCGPSCCEPGSAGSTDTARRTAEAIGYSADELDGLPADANLGLGCGNPTAIASLEPGQTVLDLGSGAGIDCFLAARQVGPTGKVIGVDMTAEMISRARANAASGGFDNVEFRLGEIEALPVADATVDVIISNCVLNLSPERSRVLAEAMRVLKPGGRIVVSDMVSDLGVPEVVAGSLDAVAGCLPTPRDVYQQEFRDAGFADVTISDEKPYPQGYLLQDEGVKTFLADHPEARPDLEAFAGSIFGAVITGVRR